MSFAKGKEVLKKGFLTSQRMVGGKRYNLLK